MFQLSPFHELECTRLIDAPKDFERERLPLTTEIELSDSDGTIARHMNEVVFNLERAVSVGSQQLIASLQELLSFRAVRIQATLTHLLRGFREQSLKVLFDGRGALGVLARALLRASVFGIGSTQW